MIGCDYSTWAVDLVYLDEDGLQPPLWRRYELEGGDAFDRARDVRRALPRSFAWDEVVAFGIEDPRGQNAGAIYRVQGAILACLPRSLLVQPWVPSQWRRSVGLPGNASKEQVRAWALAHALDGPLPDNQTSAYRASLAAWPNDATDAYAVALATLNALQHGEQAA